MAMWRAVDLTGYFVHLRTVRESDAEGILAAATEDRSTYAYTWVPGTLAQVREHVATQLEELHEGRSIPLVVEDVNTGRIVGQTRYLDIEYLVDRFVAPARLPDPETPPRAVEIGGTWYASSVQRSAVNTECKLLMLSHAFDCWEVLRVSLKTDSRNARSLQAIERIGAKFEGVRRAHMRAPDGTIRDSAYFSIVSDEWPDVRLGLLQRLGHPDH